MKEILLFWDIVDLLSIEKIDSFGNSVFSITCLEQKYILKEHKNNEKVEKESILLSRLQEKIPIAAPIKSKDNKYYVEYNDKFYVLYPFLEGSSFSDHYSPKYKEQASALGKAIGILHSELYKIDFKECKTFDLINDVLSWAKGIIEENSEHFDLNSIFEILDQYERDFKPIYKLLPKQIIHRDIHPGNMLFNGYELTGIVDFELSVKGIRVFDPAYCSTSILISTFDNEDKRSLWKDILFEILSAYNKINQLTEEERIGFIYVLYSIHVIFIAFCCTVNNIDAAKCNERALKWLYKNQGMINKCISTIA